MRQLTPAIICLLAFSMVAAACGGDDDGGGSDLSSGERALADAIADQLLDDPDDDLPMTRAQAQCISEGMVDDVGLDKLVEIGLSEEAVRAGTGPDDVDVPDEVVNDFVDVMMDCVDMAALMVAGMTEDGDVSEDSAKCLADGIVEDYEDFLEQAARSGITGEEFDVGEDARLMVGIMTLMADCFTDEEFTEIMGG